MKIRIFALCLTVLFCQNNAVQAQSASWAWAKKGTGNYGNAGNSIALDGAGNSYVTGYFGSASVNFSGTVLTNSTPFIREIFIAKYSPTGSLLWAKNAQGHGQNEAEHIAVDQSGNSVITGYYQSDTLFLGNDSLYCPAGKIRFFLAKYDASGQALWARSSGDTGFATGSFVIRDPHGNYYATGSFRGRVSFGGHVLVNTDSAKNDIFLVKYDGSGNVLWAKRAGGTDDDFAHGISLDAAGNCYMTGSFSSTSIIFGPDTLTHASYMDKGFIAKYDSMGQALWAEDFIGIVSDYGISLASEPNGNTYLLGDFYGPTFTLGNVTLTNAGNTNTEDIFLAKLDSSGAVLWAKSAGGLTADVATQVALDGQSHVLITGSFDSHIISFGNNVTLTNVPLNGDAFVAWYDTAGNILRALNPVGSGIASSYGICADIIGNAYITGAFSGPNMVFGNTTLTCNTNNGNYGVYTAKIDTGLSAGISAIDNKGLITIFPNPGTGLFTVQAGQQMSQLTVTDITGRKIFGIAPHAHAVTFHLTGLTPGIYFIQITNEAGIMIGTKKIVLE